MPITKYDLSIISNHYFIWALESPKHPVTPDACADFAYNCYSIILSIPSDENAYRNLLNYIIAQADYYGVNIEKANEFLKQVPGVQQLFIQYIKDNYRIETNAEIFQRLVKDGFGYIGDTIAGGLWSLIKKFIPLILLGFGIIYLIPKRKA